MRTCTSLRILPMLASSGDAHPGSIACTRRRDEHLPRPPMRVGSADDARNDGVLRRRSAYRCRYQGRWTIALDSHSSLGRELQVTIFWPVRQHAHHSSRYCSRARSAPPEKAWAFRPTCSTPLCYTRTRSLHSSARQTAIGLSVHQWMRRRGGFGVTLTPL